MITITALIIAFRNQLSFSSPQQLYDIAAGALHSGQALDFITAAWWVPRSNCGYFPAWLISVYVVSQVLIWLSYERIPFELSKLAGQGYTLFSREGSRRFISFIRLCGRGHLLDGVLVFIWPHYMLFAFWHFATAIVSHRTALMMKTLSEKMLTEREVDLYRWMRTEISELPDIEDVKGFEGLKAIRESIDSLDQAAALKKQKGQ